MRSLILVAICLLTWSQAANALFDDKEARKKILELEQQMQTQNQATRESLEAIKKNQQAMEERIASMEAIVKGQGLVDLLSQLEQLKQELRTVKGQLEVATHNINESQQRQRDLYGDVDGRLRKLETAGPAVAAGDGSSAADTAVPARAGGGEQQDLEAARKLSQAGKHREAFDAYEKFLQTYPGSERAPEAQYYLGYAQFSLKNYKASIATQQKMLSQYPNHPKAPDAMFNIANSQIQLSDIDGARKTLRELLSKYPNSDAAPNAKRRLTVLDSIKTR